MEKKTSRTKKLLQYVRNGFSKRQKLVQDRTGTTPVGRYTKGKKARHVPIHPDVKEGEVSSEKMFPDGPEAAQRKVRAQADKDLETARQTLLPRVRAELKKAIISGEVDKSLPPEIAFMVSMASQEEINAIIEEIVQERQEQQRANEHVPQQDVPTEFDLAFGADFEAEEILEAATIEENTATASTETLATTKEEQIGSVPQQDVDPTLSNDSGMNGSILDNPATAPIEKPSTTQEEPVSMPQENKVRRQKPVRVQRYIQQAGLDKMREQEDRDSVSNGVGQLEKLHPKGIKNLNSTQRAKLFAKPKTDMPGDEVVLDTLRGKPLPPIEEGKEKKVTFKDTPEVFYSEQAEAVPVANREVIPEKSNTEGTVRRADFRARATAFRGKRTHTNRTSNTPKPEPIKVNFGRSSNKDLPKDLKTASLQDPITVNFKEKKSTDKPAQVDDSKKKESASEKRSKYKQSSLAYRDSVSPIRNAKALSGLTIAVLPTDYKETKADQRRSTPTPTNRTRSSSRHKRGRPNGR